MRLLSFFSLISKAHIFQEDLQALIAYVYIFQTYSTLHLMSAFIYQIPQDLFKGLPKCKADLHAPVTK